MAPFLQFRLWLREGPLGERVLAVVGAVVLLALVALATVPVRDGDDDGTTIAGEQIGGSSTGGSGSRTSSTVGSGTTGDDTATTIAGDSTGALAGTSTTGTSEGGSGSDGSTGSLAGATATTGDASTGATSGGGTQSCAGRAASAPGISPTEVRVDLSAVDLAGPVANSAFGIRPDMHDVARAVVDDINKHGGVACGRKLVAKIYTVNAVDSGDQQRKCLQMVQEKPFAVIDGAGYARPGPRACFVQNKQLFQASTLLSNDEVAKSNGYMYGASSTVHTSVRNALLRLKEMGWFAPPKFKKLGLFLEACDPTLNAEIDRTLSRIGIRPQDTSKFTTDCQLIAPPNQITAGAVKHKTDGATHVFLASSLSNSQNYTRRANEQQYRPTYGASDQGSLATSSSAPNWQGSFDGGIVVTTTRSGGLTSGVPSDAARRCSKVLTEHGLKGIENEVKDSTAYSWCDQLYFFVQAMGKAGVNPTRVSFLQGLGTMGHFDSANAGDGEWDRAGKVTGGDYHRPIRWHSDCTCYKVAGEFKRNV